MSKPTITPAPHLAPDAQEKSLPPCWLCSRWGNVPATISVLPHAMIIQMLARRADEIACRFIDTDYKEKSFFVQDLLRVPLSFPKALL